MAGARSRIKLRGVDLVAGSASGVFIKNEFDQRTDQRLEGGPGVGQVGAHERTRQWPPLIAAAVGAEDDRQVRRMRGKPPSKPK